MAPAVSAFLLLAGVIVVAWALLHQQGDPPPVSSRPEAASIIDPAATGAGGGAPDAAASTASAAPEAPTEPKASATTDRTPEPESEPEPLALDPSEPVAVRINSIDVSSDLHALGLTQEGALEVPSGDLYNQAAWYEGSPTPGEIGPAVVEGHVTSQGSVPSVFFDLGAVAAGDDIEIDRADGRTAVFEVYETGSFPKDDFPSLAVYGRTSDAELRVITCGGEYSAEQRRHLDNVVVFARLVDVV